MAEEISLFLWVSFLALDFEEDRESDLCHRVVDAKMLSAIWMPARSWDGPWLQLPLRPCSIPKTSKSCLNVPALTQLC